MKARSLFTTERIPAIRLAGVLEKSSRNRGQRYEKISPYFAMEYPLRVRWPVRLLQGGRS